MSFMGDLFDRSRSALHLTQLELARMLGASRRTGQRWDAGQSIPSIAQLHRLAAACFPVDRKLAADIAAKAGTTLEKLGLVVAPPPAPEPSPEPASPAPPLAAPPPPPPLPSVVDSVVCAAAEAMGLAPQAVRPALVAAFARAQELGLDVEAVQKGLAGPAPKKERTGRREDGKEAAKATR